jgi:hypothetical protein
LTTVRFSDGAVPQKARRRHLIARNYLALGIYLASDYNVDRSTD